jgi:hypothetical protein
MQTLQILIPIIITISGVALKTWTDIKIKYAADEA